jgi:high-affinity iron transporter
MIASFVITFREALEAALIIGIVAAYLRKVGRKDMERYLFIGVAGAILASVLAGALFLLIYGGLEGRAEEIFEGVASLSAAAVLTYMIFFFAKHAKGIKGELQNKVDASLGRGSAWGIAALAFLAVFREGVETVLFLGAIAVKEPLSTLVGLIAGIVAVTALSIAMFAGIYRLDYAKFFKYTSVILVIFAAGLVAYSVHELNEAGIIPPVIEHVWDINPPPNEDGTYPALHEKGIIGSMLKSLIGYNGNPSLTEVLAYLGYWLTVGYFLTRNFRDTKQAAGAKAETL